MAYSERLLENQERLSMRDMRLRVAKLILRGVASSTIAQAEGYPSYTARELSSYFSYSSISISSKPEPELYYYYLSLVSFVHYRFLLITLSLETVALIESDAKLDESESFKR